MGNILELQDISHAYHGMEGETLAISHLSFSLKQGDFVSIVGPSGCGNPHCFRLFPVSFLPKAER